MSAPNRHSRQPSRQGPAGNAAKTTSSASLTSLSHAVVRFASIIAIDTASKSQCMLSQCASAAVLVAVTRARANVRAHLHCRRCCRPASESRHPCAPPPPSSSPSREQEPTSVCTSTPVIVAITQTKADVPVRLRRCHRCRHTSESQRPRAPPPPSSLPSALGSNFQHLPVSKPPLTHKITVQSTRIDGGL